MWNKKGIVDAINDILAKCVTPIGNYPPLFKKIDVWNNQLRYEKDGIGYSFPTPAIYLEMKQINSKQLGMGVNIVSYDVIFHIIHTQLNNGNLLDRNTQVLNLKDFVKKKFEYYQPAQMGRLGFIRGQQDFEHDNVYHFVMTFKGTLVDTWGNYFPSQGTASLHLDIELTEVRLGVGYDIIGNTLVVYP